MDTVFRLIYSCFAIHWRSVLMSFDTNLHPSWLSRETVKQLNLGLHTQSLAIQECLLMTGLINLCMIGSAIYCAGTAMIRYIYIRTSLQQEINEAYKRTKFLYLALSTGLILCFIHVGAFFYSQYGKSGLER